jgi:hypothetical protein
MGNNDLASQMKASFKDVWAKRLLAYGRLNNLKYSSIIKEMEEAIDSGCQEEGTMYNHVINCAPIIIE